MCSLLNILKLFALLELVKRLALHLDHVSVSEWEVADALDSLHLQLLLLSTILLVFQDLICQYEGVSFMNFVLILKVSLFLHLLALIFKQALFILLLLDPLYNVSVFLFVNLTDDLTKEIIVVFAIEDHLLFETIIRMSVNIGLHRRVHLWYLLLDRFFR